MDSLPETAEPLANVKFQVTKMEQDQAGNGTKRQYLVR